jgi:hypothetical protein
MVCDSRKCLPEAKFLVLCGTSSNAIDSSLILKLMKHDFCSEALAGGRQDDFNLPENLEAQ